MAWLELLLRWHAAADCERNVRRGMLCFYDPKISMKYKWHGARLPVDILRKHGQAEKSEVNLP